LQEILYSDAVFPTYPDLPISGLENMMSMNMPNMLAYTIQSTLYAGGKPSICVDYGKNATWFVPQSPQDDSYWIVFLNAKNPRERVKEWVVPGQNNSAVPSGIETYMNDPDYIFVVATQFLSTLHLPQGPWYDFLAKYGAGKALQRLEQMATVLSCGSFSHMAYILTGQGGPRTPPQPPPISYELSSFANAVPALMLMSLMPMPNGGPPYSICDSYTFHH
jgi:hypothetical protein